MGQTGAFGYSGPPQQIKRKDTIRYGKLLQAGMMHTDPQGVGFISS